MKQNSSKLQLSFSTKSFAEDAAFYRIMENPNNPVNANYSISNRLFTGLGRMVNELFGRLVQDYPGEFIKQREKELSKYPRLYQTR